MARTKQNLHDFEWMNGVLRHVDSYTGHVVRASSLMDDNDLKVEHSRIKHIKIERDEIFNFNL